MTRIAILLAALTLAACDTSEITKPLPPYNAAVNVAETLGVAPVVNSPAKDPKP
jgi:hypothetical protein